MKPKLISGLLSIVILLSACGQENGPAPADPATDSPASAPLSEPAESNAEATMPADEGTLQEGPAATPSPASTSPADPTAAPAEPASPTPSPAEPAEPEEPVAEAGPIEVTYFTPSQGEGPYYPIVKLDERDNDLTLLAGASGRPAGQIVEFGGTVFDAAGMPQPGVLVEIWQTDASGVYMHPGDPGTDGRDLNFQFYGESVTSADGGYNFRTILPGRYEPRPRHIHVKVKVDGQELLTTQFYFADDPELAGESMFNQVGGDGEHLVITLEEAQDEDGNTILVGQRDIVLNVALSTG